MHIKKINTTIKELTSQTKKPKIILGLSGGPDSVFLFHILNALKKENKIELIAAHLNHGWRNESDKDEKFCQKLCSENNIKFLSTHANQLKINFKQNGSKEEFGRKLRQHFFVKSLKKENANFIALAHHLQDQQETFFWRIIRGTSLSGLGCMKEKNGFYIRPLLKINKKDILEYLTKNEFKYKEDKSNLSDNFLRNKIRKYVLTALEKSDPRFNKKFQDTLSNLQEEEKFLTKLTQKNFQETFTQQKDCLSGNLKTFLDNDLVIQKRLIIQWLCNEKVKFENSSSLIKEIIRFLDSPRGGAHKIYPHLIIRKKEKKFWLEKI